MICQNCLRPFNNEGAPATALCYSWRGRPGDFIDCWRARAEKAEARLREQQQLTGRLSLELTDADRQKRLAEEALIEAAKTISARQETIRLLNRRAQEIEGFANKLCEQSNRDLYELVRLRDDANRFGKNWQAAEETCDSLRTILEELGSLLQKHCPEWALCSDMRGQILGLAEAALLARHRQDVEVAAATPHDIAGSTDAIVPSREPRVHGRMTQTVAWLARASFVVDVASDDTDGSWEDPDPGPWASLIVSPEGAIAEADRLGELVAPIFHRLKKRAKKQLAKRWPSVSLMYNPGIGSSSWLRLRLIGIDDHELLATTTLGEIAFNVYARAGESPGIAFDGRPIPAWRDLDADVRDAWCCFAAAISAGVNYGGSAADLAENAFCAYGSYVDWKRRDGSEIPNWDGLNQPTRQRWQEAAGAVASASTAAFQTGFGVKP